MSIKNVLINGAVGLFAIVMTTELVKFAQAGNCLWYCDDQVEWVKHIYNEPGQVQQTRCSRYEARFQRFLYTDDSVKNIVTNSSGDTAFKSYADSVCTPSCEQVALPVKATGNIPQGQPLHTGLDPNKTCSLDT